MRSSPFTRTTFVALLLAGVLVACHHRPAPSNVVEPETPTARNALDVVPVFELYQNALRDSVVRFALAQVGIRYEYGGATPSDGFDCSGLIRYVLAETFIAPPRTASQQARIGAPIRRDGLRPADLLAFGAGDSITHIGIYVGNRRFVHASSVAGRVIVSSIDRPPSRLIKPLKGARRVILESSGPEPRGAGI